MGLSVSETNPVARVFRWLVGPPIERVGRCVEQRVEEEIDAMPEPPWWAAPVAVLSGAVGALAVQLVGGRGEEASERAEREPVASAERGTTSDADAEAVEVARALLTLGVEEPDQSKAKAAYRSLVVETHPDQGGDAETFEAVHEAWETVESSERLSDGPDDDGGN